MICVPKLTLICIYLFIYLFICPFIHFFICPFVHLFIYLFGKIESQQSRQSERLDVLSHFGHGPQNVVQQPSRFLLHLQTARLA